MSLALFALVAFAIAAPREVSAGTVITVNTTLDDTDGTDGLCSLREAIVSANTNTTSGAAAGECAAGVGGSADTIQLDNTAIYGASSVPLPAFSADVVIIGNGSVLTGSNNAAVSPVLTVSAGTVELRTVEVSAGSGTGNGGGISISGGDLTVSDSSVVRNGGGGIHINGGNLSIVRSEVSDNTSTNRGAGIDAELGAGMIVIEDSTIADNTSTTDAGGFFNLGSATITDSAILRNEGGSGGGVLNVGSLTVTRSTFASNVATAGQGGGLTNAFSGTLNLVNSTVSGNQAISGASDSEGGGIYHLEFGGGSVSLVHTTVTNNSASIGSGMSVTTNGNPVEVTASIIGDNPVTADMNGFISGSDVEGAGFGSAAYTSGGFNVIGSMDSDATSAFVSAGDLTDASALLSPLGSFGGGATLTHALWPTSPAIDRVGTIPVPPATDQNGTARPVGPKPDSGAYEAVPVLCNGLVVTIDMNLGAPGTGTNGDDVILGTPGPDQVFGLGGDDTICGEGGADNLNGGNGSDTILGGPGEDFIGGQGGVDTLFGEGDDDEIAGGIGNDEIHGGDGEDTLRGQGDDDQLFGEGDVDTIFGGSGNDMIQTGPGGNLGTAHVVTGNGNNDTITGSGGNDDLDGQQGLDVINGAGGDDLLRGGLGADTLNGDAGNDTLQGAGSADTLNGGADNDSMSGGGGAPDRCNGDGGVDTLADATCEIVTGVP